MRSGNILSMLQRAVFDPPAQRLMASPLLADFDSLYWADLFLAVLIPFVQFTNGLGQHWKRALHGHAGHNAID